MNVIYNNVEYMFSSSSWRTQQVDAGCIPPMCELLTVVDSQIIHVALNGLENILKAGDLDKTKPNPYAVLIEECYG